VLGLPVPAFRFGIFAVSSLAVAVSVTTVGVVGFIGLVVPHLVRLVAGSDHSVVLPASALAGGTLLVIADTLARTVAAPRQLPVGAITAALGVPLFLYLMSRRRTPQPRKRTEDTAEQRSAGPTSGAMPALLRRVRMGAIPPGTPPGRGGAEASIANGHERCGGRRRCHRGKNKDRRAARGPRGDRW